MFETEPVSHWLASFAAAGVPSSPINTYSQALGDPQVEHMGWVQAITLPNGKTIRTFGSPVRINGASVPVFSRPPALGEHTEEVLRKIDPQHLGTPAPTSARMVVSRLARSLAATAGTAALRMAVT